MTTLVLLFALAVPPHGNGYVNDYANMLSADQVQALNATLIGFRDRTTIEFAILIVPTLGGEDIRSYANVVLRQWGIGLKGVNNGLLLLWATKERRVRIEVGYGLEAKMTDGRTGDIIRDQILPQFKLQRWNDGLTAGVAAVITQLEPPKPAEAIAAAPLKATDDVAAPVASSFPFMGALIVVGVFGSCVLFAIWVFRRRRKQEEESAAAYAALNRAWRDKPRQSAFHDDLNSRTSRETYVTTPDPPSYAPVFVPYIVPEPEPERRRSSSSSSSSSSSDSSSSSSSSWSSGSDSSSASFSGGDSGGGGADGSY